MAKAPFGWTEIKGFYGWDPVFAEPDRLLGWEALMVVVPPPPGFHFYYDANANGKEDANERARGIRVHPAVADELKVCLQLVADAGLWHFVSAEAGGYNFRQQRGSSKLSMHSLGGAIDFDPVRNPFKRPAELTALGTEPGLGVVRIFQERGWTWGGEWARPDAQHIQWGGGF